MIRVVICNCPPDNAEEIALALVGEKLAACVNLIPGVKSIYRWQGDVTTDTETTLFIKTTADRYPALEARLTALHPYDTPEIISLPPDAVAPKYAAWVAHEVTDETNT